MSEKPYGYVRKDGNGLFIYGEHKFQNPEDHDLVPVYTHPREWQGLTDDEIEEAARGKSGHDEFARAIEAKLKEKNT